MGLTVFAIFFIVIYIFYAQNNKRKKENKKIDNYLIDNREEIISQSTGRDFNLPDLQGYCIYKCQKGENVLTPLDNKRETISLTSVQYSSNINYIEIQKGKVDIDKKFYFTDKGYQHIYVFKEFLENECLVFVTKRASIDDHLSEKYKRR